MKIGLILECGPGGADMQVCEHLVRKLIPNAEVSSVTLDNKRNLIAQSGEAAAGLRLDGCERILILWDLYPPWRDSRPCRREDRLAIINALNDAGLDRETISLVCIREELEAWLLADGRAVSSVLSTQAHPVKIPDTKAPDRVSRPKTRLNQLFQKHCGRQYTDRYHALKIIQALPDLTRIRNSASFRRFEAKVTGQ